jgi:prepilin-type N-terminal cleavage/methylation domain-containing protein
MKKKYTHPKSSNTSSGFTLIELIVVIVIIAILVIILFVSYIGAQGSARDAGVLSDIDRLDALETSYASKNNVGGWAYYSANGYDSTIGFSPSNGNVIDVVVNSTDYCIRGYNTAGNKNSIFNAYTRESTPGACSYLNPSTAAIAAYTGPKVWIKISVGYLDTCGIASNYQAYCWGYNSYGQLGNNSTTDSPVPVPVITSGVLSGKTIVSIAVGQYHTCVLASDDQVYCWGYNVNGQLGNNTFTQSPVPVAVNTSGVFSGKTIKAISSRGSDTCAIASDNQAYCWGSNGYGQLGNNSVSDSSVPVAVVNSGVLSGKTIASISTGQYHSCVIASDSQAYCWGYNAINGALGNNSYVNSSVPVAVTTSGVLSGKTISSISTGYNHSCVVASDNQIYCWGNGVDGELGNNTTTTSPVPVAVVNTGVLSGKSVLSTFSGDNQTCAIASDNQAYCWGYNSEGILGNNSSTNSPIPVAVTTSGALSGNTILSGAGSTADTCVIASNFNAYCWGDNGHGQFGNNTMIPSMVPVAVNSPT